MLRRNGYDCDPSETLVYSKRIVHKVTSPRRDDRNQEGRASDYNL